MIYIILLLLIFAAFIFPRNKILNAVLFVFIYSLFAFSYDDDDFLNYQFAYDNFVAGGSSNYEPLYQAIMYLAGKFGLTFIEFRLITSFAIILSLDAFFIKLSDKPNVLLALYLIYSSFYDATLVRNSLAFSIAIWGIYQLMKARSIKESFLSLPFFIVASLFHESYWIFIFFTIVFILLDKKKYFLVSSSFVTLYVICFLFQDFLLLIFSNFIVKAETIDDYSTRGGLNVIGQIYIVLKYFILILPILVFNNNLQSFGSKNAFIKSKIFNLNVAFILIAILQIVAPSYSRLLRILIVFNYAHIINYKSIRISERYVFALAYSVVMLLLAFLWERPETLQTIIQMHFKTNLFFNYI